MSKSFFTRGAIAATVASIALGATACSGDGKPKLYNTDNASNAGGSYKAMRCGEGLQTVDITVGSSSNAQGLTTSVKEMNDASGQVKVVVVATVPAAKELPLVIVHALDDIYGYGATDDKKLEPSVGAGGKLDMELATAQYAESPSSGGRITGLTLCVRSVDATDATTS